MVGVPATTILPSGWTATAYAVSLPAPIGVVTLPPVPNVLSGVPSRSRRITAKSPRLSETRPAMRILPRPRHAWSAREEPAKSYVGGRARARTQERRRRANPRAPRDRRSRARGSRPRRTPPSPHFDWPTLIGRVVLPEALSRRPDPPRDQLSDRPACRARSRRSARPIRTS
jgi:hypothetical protein